MLWFRTDKDKVETVIGYVNRQSLLGLLFAQFGAVLLHLQRLPIWLILLALVVFVWRIQIFRNQWSFPNRVIRTLLVLCSVVSVIANYHEWYALEPMVTLLVIAFLLKLLEVERKRDAIVLIFVGFFVTASGFLFDQGIVTTLIGVVVLWMLSACLMVVHGTQSQYLSRRTMRIISVLLLQSVPLMLLMLFVFPRIGALWSVPIQSSSAVTGVSDSMSPGDFSQLTRSRALAFRVSFENNQVPNPSQRYWRGLVFSQFDGRSWLRQNDNLLNKPTEANNINKAVSHEFTNSYKPNKNSNNLRYQVVLEPTNTRWLYGIPYANILKNLVDNRIDNKIIRSSSNEIFLDKPVTQRIQYAVDSAFSFQTIETNDSLRRALLLPRDYNPRTIAMAQKWRRESVSTEAYVNRVLQFYNENFQYTLSPPKLGKNTADEFLFETQSGFCEHFSSSFVVLMRAAAIPARVVTGYQGGQWNSDDQYLLVRQYDAHAWAEIWMPPKGWVRIDPTAAVAPNRIEQGLLDTLSDSEQELLEPRSLPSFAWINRLALKWDSLNYRWQKWVLSYDQDQQSKWLQRLLGEVTATRMAILLVAPGMLLLGIFGLLALRNRSKPTSRKVKLYYYLIKRLQKMGIDIDQENGATFSELFFNAKTRLPLKVKAFSELESIFNTAFYSNSAEISRQDFHKIKKRIRVL